MEPKTELQRNAIVTEQRKELETYQRALDIQYLNNRVEGTQMGRCLALIKKETEMEKDFMERRDHAAIVNARAQKEIALGIEIANKSREDTCQLLRRHYLRERDPQLRDMVRKLQGAYVRKDLEQQILQNQYRKLQNKVEEAAANRILSEALLNKEAAEEEAKSKVEKRREYMCDLQQQLVNTQQQRHCQFEDTLIEKKMLEDISRTLADEDQREVQHKRERTEKIRREMEVFQQAREAWRDKQREVIRQEERRAQAQRVAAVDRDAAVVQERERKNQIKEEANKKIVAKMAADKAARMERDDVVRQLQEQEHLERNAQEDERERQKRASTRSETRSSLLSQMESHRREEAEQRARDERYRLQVQAKMSAEDEKERKREEQRKKRAREYAVELRRQIEENERRRAGERRAEEKRAEYVWTCRDNWDAEARIEEEKMMREHASVLRRGDVTAAAASRADCSQRH